MSDAAAPPPSTSSDAPKPEDVPLEDIDRLLAGEDPEFTKSLEEVRAVESDKDVSIEASAIAEDGQDGIEAKPDSRLGKIRHAIRLKVARAKSRIKARMATLGKDALIFLKTRPKEFALYLVVLLKAGLKSSKVPIVAFQKAGKWQRLAGLAMVFCFVAALWVLLANFKGVWLPQINRPILQNLETQADQVETYNPKDGGESFYAAFPQERDEFLFSKMKVNLKRTGENPNPMGAFELIVLLDSKDTAIEVRDREVEFSDLLQRVLEDQTFNELETELGKNRLKSQMKRELNQKLTQGWVKDVNFKTFILKP